MFTEVLKNRKLSSSRAVILHLDGDRKYSKRAINYYNSLNLKSIVENISERNQPNEVVYLLEKYKPDILVATGHDLMLKKGQDLYKLDNYKNSRYFVQTVKNARTWEKSEEKLIIIAGACESFYEAIMLEGANFASSPARIMVEYRDPLIIASKIAYTDSNKYVRMKDLLPYLKSNYKGMGGTKARGKKNLLSKWQECTLLHFCNIIVKEKKKKKKNPWKYWNKAKNWIMTNCYIFDKKRLGWYT